MLTPETPEILFAASSSYFRGTTAGAHLGGKRELLRTVERHPGRRRLDAPFQSFSPFRAVKFRRAHAQCAEQLVGTSLVAENYRKASCDHFQRAPSLQQVRPDSASRASVMRPSVTLSHAPLRSSFCIFAEFAVSMEIKRLRKAKISRIVPFIFIWSFRGANSRTEEKQPTFQFSAFLTFFA